MTDDPFDPAALKALCAHLGVETTVVTDAYGRTDIRLDRHAMQTLRDAARQHGFDDIADGLQHALDRGGRRH